MPLTPPEQVPTGWCVRLPPENPHVKHGSKKFEAREAIDVRIMNSIGIAVSKAIEVSLQDSLTGHRLENVGRQDIMLLTICHMLYQTR